MEGMVDMSIMGGRVDMSIVGDRVDRREEERSSKRTQSFNLPRHQSTSKVQTFI